MVKTFASEDKVKAHKVLAQWTLTHRCKCVHFLYVSASRHLPCSSSRGAARISKHFMQKKKNYMRSKSISKMLLAVRRFQHVGVLYFRTILRYSQNSQMVESLNAQNSIAIQRYNLNLFQRCCTMNDTIFYLCVLSSKLRFVEKKKQWLYLVLLVPGEGHIELRQHFCVLKRLQLLLVQEVFSFVTAAEEQNSLSHILT